MKKVQFSLLAIFISLQIQAQILNVNEYIQTKNQWCWAAATACVLDYYCNPISQCEIAEYTRSVAAWHNFGENNCCTDSAKACNYWNYNWGEEGSMQDILVHFANIENYGTGILPMEELRNEIQNNRLSILRWEYNNGNGHFLVAHGLVNDKLYYLNPWFGEGLKISDYSWFKKGSNHKWTSTNRIAASPENSVAGFAGPISGQAAICKGQDTVHYYIDTIQNALNYIWSLPKGVRGSSTVNSISVVFGDSVDSGNISVKGSNECGEGMASVLRVKVCEKPDTAGFISGQDTLCCGEIVNYTVPEIQNATAYHWDLPPGATGSSTSNSIVVSYSDSASSGLISVRGINECEEGKSSAIAVTVNAIPESNAVLHGDVLWSDAVSGNQWYNQDGPITGASERSYSPDLSGEYYLVVNSNGCISAPSDTLSVNLTGSGHIKSGKAIQVYPNPFLDELTLKNIDNTRQVSFELLNAKGQVLFSGNLDEEITISTSNYAPGLYFIRSENGRELEVKKLSKDK